MTLREFLTENQNLWIGIYVGGVLYFHASGWEFLENMDPWWFDFEIDEIESDHINYDVAIYLK